MCRIPDSWLKILGLELGVQGLGFKIQHGGFRVHCSLFKVQGGGFSFLRFQVSGFGLLSRFVVVAPASPARILTHGLFLTYSHLPR